MAAGQKRGAWVACVGLVLAVAMPATPASAGFFEQLFGGLRHAFTERPAPRRVEPAPDPLRSFARASDGPDERVVTRDAGPARGFCVRTCDGHYFPIAAHPGLSPAEACKSFCPASETRVYSGSNIDYATAADGSRYADLANAYRYRKQLVAGCTCNGRTAFGLAHVDAASDPTLRPGDVLATRQGLMVADGGRGAANFTPVASSTLPKSERAALAEIRVAPNDTVPYRPIAAAARDARRAELARGR